MKKIRGYTWQVYLRGNKSLLRVGDETFRKHGGLIDCHTKKQYVYMSTAVADWIFKKVQQTLHFYGVYNRLNAAGSSNELTV